MNLKTVYRTEDNYVPALAHELAFTVIYLWYFRGLVYTSLLGF